MTQQTSPFLEGKFGWALGESNWNLGMDENLLKFSYMFDKNIDGIVSSLPAAVNGAAYFNTTDNRIHYVVNGSYSSTPVPKWFIVTLRTTGATYQFDGTTLNAIPSNSDINTDLQAYKADVLDSTDPAKGAAKQGYKGRTTYARLSDSLNVRDYISTSVDGVTSNQTGVVAAVAAAFASGSSLYWAAGTYVSTANIPNFHDVRHLGDGVVKRGLDTFKIAQRSTQTNIIYANPTGSATNDGLSADEPISTLQVSVNVLNNYGPILPGIWRVQLAAGTFTGLCTFPENVRGKERVQIIGPTAGHPNVPTAIVDGAGSQSFGLNFNGNNKMLLQDIKFQNFLDYGVVSQDLCDIYTLNVHTNAITGGRGIGMLFQQGRYRVYGGIINNSGTYGLEFISQTTVSVGALNNNITGGVQILNSGVSAVLFQENATGHFDYATTDGNVYGIDLVEKSRINSTGCLIKNSTGAGVRTRDHCNWLNSLGTNTFTGNTVNQKHYSWSGETDTVNLLVTQVRTIIDTNQITHTGTTTETTLKTYSPGIKADTFNWNGRSHKIIITGQFTGNASTKTLRVKFGGNLVHGLVSVASSTGFFKYEGIIHATGNSTQAYNASMLDSSATIVKVDSGTRAISMVTGADQAITVTGQLGAAGESIVIHAVEMWETA